MKRVGHAVPLTAVLCIAICLLAVPFANAVFAQDEGDSGAAIGGTNSTNQDSGSGEEEKVGVGDLIDEGTGQNSTSDTGESARKSLMEQLLNKGSELENQLKEVLGKKLEAVKDSEKAQMIKDYTAKTKEYVQQAIRENINGDGASLDKIKQAPEAIVNIIKSINDSKEKEKALEYYNEVVEALAPVIKSGDTAKAAELTEKLIDSAGQLLDGIDARQDAEVQKLVDKLTSMADSVSSEQAGKIQVKADNGTGVIKLDEVNQKIESLVQNSNRFRERIKAKLGSDAKTEDKKVLVDVENPEGIQKLNVKIPVDVLDSMEKNKVQTLSLNMGKARIKLSPELKETALGENPSNGTNLSFGIEEVKSGEAKELLQAASEDMKSLDNVPVLNFSASAEEGSNTRIMDHDLGSGVEIEIPMDGIDMSQVDTDKLAAVVYIENVENTENLEELAKLHTWQLVGGKYDPYSKSFVFNRKSFSMYTIMQINKSFGDLAKYDWAKKDIELMASKGIVTGKTTNQFDPAANVTRAEFAALVVRTLGLMDNKAQVGFKDVKKSDWYYAAVASAYKAGIVTGKTSSSFEPNAPITRQEMMQIVANAMEKALGMTKPGDAKVNAAINGFADKNMVAGWAKPAAAFSITEGIIKGKTATAIKPQDYATRAETAVIAKRLYDLM